MIGATAPLPRHPRPTRTDADVERLLAWAAAEGASLDAVRAAPAPTGGYGLFARRALAEGERILAVPRALLITDLDAASSPVGRATAALAATLGPQPILAAWLATVDAEPATRWRPYLDALPQAPPLPQFRSTVELDALLGTRARAIIDDAIAATRAEAAALTPRAPAADLARYAWARAAVRSRCFGVDGLPGVERVLVPVVDLCNAGPPSGRWRYDADLGAFVVTASRDLAAGDELLISYGDHDNPTLLTGYGFARADNPADRAWVQIGADGHALAATLDDALRAALGAGDGFALTRFAIAVDAARARLELGAPITDDAWGATCAIVRAGERAVLDELAGFAARVASPVPATWRALAERTDDDGPGAALARAYAAERCTAT